MDSTVSNEPNVDSESNVTSESTLGGELVSGLLGAGVAIVCVMLPLLHLVTAPLGPFIGGFVAANRGKPGPRGRVVIAVTIGTAVATLIAVAALVFTSLVGKSQLPTWFPAGSTLAAIVAGVWIYATTLGGVGAAVSGALSHKERPS